MTNTPVELLHRIDLYLATAVINAITSFSLGLFVYLKGKRPLHRYWFLMGICVSIWALLVGIERLVMDPRVHVVLDQIEQSFAIWIPILYLQTVAHFVSPQFPGRKFLLLRPLCWATLGLALAVC